MSGRPQLTTVEEGIAKECNLAALKTPLTPNELFYIRSHFPAPKLEKSGWSLEIDGEVQQSVKLSFSDLERLPQKTIAITMECAGNGRTFLEPPVPGLQFQFGAVGTAEWTGVPLKQVLQMAGVKPGGVEVLMRGADQNTSARSGEPQVYERSLPLAKALDPDTLLVFAMNGEELSIEHGHPVRAVVPGWYGMASVKWLTQIRVLAQPFSGPFQTESYVMMWPGKPVQPVTSLRVKSLIIEPADGSRLATATGLQKIVGVAWSHVGIERVEVSTDGGLSWQHAQVERAISSYAWQRWSLDWQPASAGRCVVQARAFDKLGAAQPLEPDWNEQGYEINPVHSVNVQVS